MKNIIFLTITLFTYLTGVGYSQLETDYSLSLFGSQTFNMENIESSVVFEAGSNKIMIAGTGTNGHLLGAVLEDSYSSGDSVEFESIAYLGDGKTTAIIKALKYFEDGSKHYIIGAIGFISKVFIGRVDVDSSDQISFTMIDTLTHSPLGYSLLYSLDILDTGNPLLPGDELTIACGMTTEIGIKPSIFTAKFSYNLSSEGVEGGSFGSPQIVDYPNAPDTSIDIISQCSAGEWNGNGVFILGERNSTENILFWTPGTSDIDTISIALPTNHRVLSVIAHPTEPDLFWIFTGYNDQARSCSLLNLSSTDAVLTHVLNFSGTLPEENAQSKEYAFSYGGDTVKIFTTSQILTFTDSVTCTTSTYTGSSRFGEFSRHKLGNTVYGPNVYIWGEVDKNMYWLSSGNNVSVNDVSLSFPSGPAGTIEILGFDVDDSYILGSFHAANYLKEYDGSWSFSRFTYLSYAQADAILIESDEDRVIYGAYPNPGVIIEENDSVVAHLDCDSILDNSQYRIWDIIPFPGADSAYLMSTGCWWTEGDNAAILLVYYDNVTSDWDVSILCEFPSLESIFYLDIMQDPDSANGDYLLVGNALDTTSSHPWRVMYAYIPDTLDLSNPTITNYGIKTMILSIWTLNVTDLQFWNNFLIFSTLDDIRYISNAFDAFDSKSKDIESTITVPGSNIIYVSSSSYDANCHEFEINNDDLLCAQVALRSGSTLVNTGCSLFDLNNLKSSGPFTNYDQVLLPTPLPSPLAMHQFRRVRYDDVDDFFYFSTLGGYIYKLISEEAGGLEEVSTVELCENFPNPFNPATVISYKVNQASNVKIKVYNIVGELVTTLTDKYHQAGEYKVKFDASHLATGVYIYSLEAENMTLVKKMLLLK